MFIANVFFKLIFIINCIESYCFFKQEILLYLLQITKVMNIIFVLIGMSIGVATLFLVGFIWAVKTGQFDDTHTPSIRMLFDDKPIKNKKK